jgi:hypothetical protein
MRLQEQNLQIFGNNYAIFYLKNEYCAVTQKGTVQVHSNNKVN